MLEMHRFRFSKNFTVHQCESLRYYVLYGLFKYISESTYEGSENQCSLKKVAERSHCSQRVINAKIFPRTMVHTHSSHAIYNLVPASSAQGLFETSIKNNVDMLGSSSNYKAEQLVFSVLLICDK